MDNFQRDVLYKISFNHTTKLVIDSADILASLYSEECYEYILFSFL